MFQITPAKSSPSFHLVERVIPHYGAEYQYMGFMDDFGNLVRADFIKLAIVFS